MLVNRRTDKSKESRYVLSNGHSSGCGISKFCRWSGHQTAGVLQRATPPADCWQHEVAPREGHWYKQGDYVESFQEWVRVKQACKVKKQATNNSQLIEKKDLCTSCIRMEARNAAELEDISPSPCCRQPLAEECFRLSCAQRDNGLR